jgi:endothelin-converting enzyme/putative endopeptidase
MVKRTFASLLVASSVVLGAGTLHAAGTPAPPPEAPLQSLPYTPSLDLPSMDRSADPCVDFYQYSCGGWVKNNPIPADQSAWSVYGKLEEESYRFLWGILRDLGTVAGKRSPAQQKIGDFFAACMDTTHVDARGAKPIAATLARIDAVKSTAELPALLADLHARFFGSMLFHFTSDQDLGDSSSVIGFASAGGLGLPDRDYYTKTDARSVTLRKQYGAHIARVFKLLGDSSGTAAAAKVMSIETALARGSLTRVELREPHNLFHKVDGTVLQALTPKLDWKAYFAALGVAPQSGYNVTQPAFYAALEQVLETRPLADIKAYLRWHVAHAAAPFLSKPFVDENFAFYSKTLRGVPTQQPRWKRCVGFTDDLLGEALGQEFVARAFGPELKAKTKLMTEQIEESMAHDLDGLNWMSATTKQKALAKLHTIVNKIGYPDAWRDYSSVDIQAGDFAGDVERAVSFEHRRQLAKIGRPLDRKEWDMTPPTVNAAYNPQLNDITFPAGVLQPPLYDPKEDDAPNYGNTGGTIGHELTHGFDDEGRQFDGAGNLKEWWTPADGKAFEERAQCIVDQYKQYTIVDDLKINSKLTEGEDIADLGGLVLAWMAWKLQTKTHPDAARDGFSPAQRFFIGYAQWACESVRPEELRIYAVTNPHSPGKYRINGTVVNMPEFQQAFQCKAGQPMVSDHRCRVW